ncbi:MAG: ImmA/IrrE family metallo-endopeptidase [Candidatus Omnitrophota bacterium]|nr:ImmA/IrrE family metallo-endopeptidase [Candidatus Omnitrophota bacterium]
MPHSIPALVTPSVMRWAREQAGFDIPTAAHRIGRSEADIRAWENEATTTRPTLAQARKAAEVYRRALAVFYLSEPPKGYQVIRDFRHLTDASLQAFSPELMQVINLLEYRQEWLREWRIEEGEKKIDFIGSIAITMAPDKVAGEIKDKLGVDFKEHFKRRTREDTLLLWVRYAEALGINICRQGEIACEEARGFVLTDEYAPFVYINSSDAKVAQLFTLVHELVHLWLNLSGISNLEGIGRTGKTENDRIEIFCNKVASLVLLDDKLFLEKWAKTDTNDPLEKKIADVANIAKVSDEVVARRLLDKSIITIDKYVDLRRQFQERWIQHKKDAKIRRQDSKGYPSPHLMAVLGNGRLFTTAVLDSYSGGFLSSTIAASLLNAKVNNFQKLSVYAGMGEGK